MWSNIGLSILPRIEKRPNLEKVEPSWGRDKAVKGSLVGQNCMINTYHIQPKSSQKHQSSQNSPVTGTQRHRLIAKKCDSLQWLRSLEQSEAIRSRLQSGLVGSVPTETQVKLASMTGAPGEVYKLAAISGLIVLACSILGRSVIGCLGRPTTALNDNYCFEVVR